MADSSTCAYCGRQCSPETIASHESGCAQNPANQSKK